MLMDNRKIKLNWKCDVDCEKSYDIFVSEDSICK